MHGYQERRDQATVRSGRASTWWAQCGYSARRMESVNEDDLAYEVRQWRVLDSF